MTRYLNLFFASQIVDEDVILIQTTCHYIFVYYRELEKTIGVERASHKRTEAEFEQ